MDEIAELQSRILQYETERQRVVRLKRTVQRLLKGCRMASGITQLQRAWDQMEQAEWQRLLHDRRHTCPACVFLELPDLLLERCRSCAKALRQDAPLPETP